MMAAFEELDLFPIEIQLLPETQEREQDTAIRTILLEALVLLTNGPEKEVLRSKNVYRVIQVMHLSEEDERCKELQVRLVGYLMREELSRGMPGVDGQGQVKELEEDEQVLEM